MTNKIFLASIDLDLGNISQECPSTKRCLQYLKSGFIELQTLTEDMKHRRFLAEKIHWAFIRSPHPAVATSRPPAPPSLKPSTSSSAWACATGWPEPVPSWTSR